MKRSLSIAMAVMSISPLTAQVMSGKGFLTASARTPGSFDTKFGAFGQTVRASAQWGVFFCSATASATLTGLRARISASAASNSPIQAPASSLADCTLTVRSGSDARIAGVLDIRGSCSVRIGADGRMEAIRSHRQIPMSVGRHGIDVRVLCGGASGGGQAVTVEFLKKPGAVVPYGKKCNAELQGAWFPTSRGHVFYFATTNAPDTPWNFLLVGTKQVTIPLPPSLCPLATDFPIVLPIAIQKGQNEARFIAPYFQGLSFNVQQMGSTRPWQQGAFWRTSNAVRITFP